MIAEKMKAAVLEKPYEIAVKEVTRPVPGPDEVLIRIHCIGICGSDVHYYSHGRIGRYVVEEPIILGHEAAGDVVEAGENVSSLSIGDRVAIEPGVACGKCSYCKSGRYNLCPDVEFMATPPFDGAWAEYAVVRSDFAYKLPEEMTYEEGALLEPFSVGFHAMSRGNVKAGDVLFISGLGPIGLLAVQAAQAFGVTTIYASDVVPARRQLALEMGVDQVFDPSAETIPQRIKEVVNGEGADICVETSGNRFAMGEAVHCVKRGGRVVFIGMTQEETIPVNLNHVIDSELDLFGIFRYANVYEKAIRALAGGKSKLNEVITHSFPLDRIKEALEIAEHQKDNSVKIMIYPGQTPSKMESPYSDTV
ncbi:NAD(P)-dependent alcohol dehydrogenase [Jeotgalibacillus sp. ET6]|uniref:NAD(P)-dependent alcohol dehydrogenase n=1 Tax=Jeotgalibacillus sp. ET6 TaxID=3037260 RepID=UPI0024188732|nr:NAD(P)-dependent alcohol dehydrogenase [Jeotgalibacillus sp. ET6]MDG5473689.1 NAD(P)-dependent alcohol dehydrogenase [Jeotgalibacillus sp. ET6]